MPEEAQEKTVTDVLNRVNDVLAAVQDTQETVTQAAIELRQTAGEARTDAAAARETSAGALQTAETAESKAQSALAKAENAKTVAGEAKTAAAGAETAAEDALTRLTAAESAAQNAASDAHAASESASNAASAAQEAIAAVDSLAEATASALAKKADTADVAAMKTGIEEQIGQKAAKTDVDAALALKADKTQLAGAASQNANGLMTAADKKKLDGIAAGAQVNPGAATQSVNGLMSAADKAKLDGIAAGATNTAAPPAAASAAPKAHGTAAVGTSAKYAREDHVHPSNNTDTHWTTHLYAGASNGAANAATANGATYLMVLDNSTVRDRRLIKGAGSVTVTSDASGNITISGTDTNTTYGAATQAANGLMSAADKKKLDGIAAGAQVNSNIFTGVVSKSANVTLGANPAAAKYEPSLVFRDSANVDIGFDRMEVDTAGNVSQVFYVRRWAANGAWSSLKLQVAANGVFRAYLSANPPAGENSGAIATTAWAIPKSGARGLLAGNETAQALSNSQTINVNSADCINLATSGAVTLTFTPAAATVHATKVLCLTASAATTLTISGAVWANNGSAPAWGNAGKRLILVAHFVAGVVVLSVADNTQ